MEILDKWIILIADFFYNWIKSMFIMSIIFLFIWLYYIPLSVSWESMEPNFYQWDLVIAETFAIRRLPKIERFDVIIVNHWWTVIIKRVIWLPNECIKLEDSKLYVDNKFVLNDFTNFNISYQNPINICLNNQEYFILWDNQKVSLDSRFFWPIYENEITWRVLVHYALWRN